MSLFGETTAATVINIKGLPQRLGGSLVAIIGVATTVTVMISLLAIGAGLAKMGLKNISPDWAIVLPSGTQSEYVGSLSRDAANLIIQAPGIRKTAEGQPMAQPMALIIVEVTKKADGLTANIPIRGSGPMGWKIDPALKLVSGRMYRPAVHELIVGKHVREQFKGFEVGDHVILRGTEWTVVGEFEAGGGMAENQIVSDADTVLAAFDRNTYQSVEVKLANSKEFQNFKDELTSNPQLNVEVKLYAIYVRTQLKQITQFLDFVGYFVGVVMAIGAVIGALNTMYSTVDGRTREIATMRAIGFGGGAVVLSVILESLMLAIPGALLGSAVAWIAFNGHTISTVGLTFPLAVTPPLMTVGVGFSLIIGLIGGIAPAIRAVRLPVAGALRGV